MEEEKFFTDFQLYRYDGENERMFVAFNGIVYDVTDCTHWRSGMHQGLHFPGQDLTAEISEAPHGNEVFSYSCVRRVGLLISTK
jgi:predicted heme/steroid binding protein